jgi:tetratricopeptide (TPR) repeat protein
VGPPPRRATGAFWLVVAVALALLAAWGVVESLRQQRSHDAVPASSVQAAPVLAPTAVPTPTPSPIGTVALTPTSRPWVEKRQPAPTPAPDVQPTLAAARAALEAGDYDAAEAAYNRVLSLDRGNGDAVVGLAKTRRARDSERALFGAAPPAASILEAERLATAGQYQAAIAAYEAILRRAPGNQQAQAGLAKARKAKEAEDRFLQGR